MNEDRVLTVQDVYNVLAEHMAALDDLWPDGECAPRKVNIVELLDGIKLRLMQRAEKNATQYESPFKKAAKKITGSTTDVTRPKQEKPVEDTGKTSMQLAHEAAQARMRR